MKLYKEYFQKSKVFFYPLLNIPKGVHYVPVETYLGWEGEYSFKEISSPDFENKFKETQEKLNFGYSKSVVWVRIRLVNTLSLPQTWLLELKNPLIDKVSLFQSSLRGEFSRKLGGDSVLFNDRDVKHRFIIFRVYLKAKDNTLL